MWHNNQWLWDTVERKPIKFLGMDIGTNPAVFYYEDRGEQKEFCFVHHSEWKHYKEMYDKQGNILV